MVNIFVILFFIIRFASTERVRHLPPPAFENIDLARTIMENHWDDIFEFKELTIVEELFSLKRENGTGSPHWKLSFLARKPNSSNDMEVFEKHFLTKINPENFVLQEIYEEFGQDDEHYLCVVEIEPKNPEEYSKKYERPSAEILDGLKKEYVDSKRHHNLKEELR